MSSKSIYFVTIFREPFNSLEDAKWKVKISFTRQEALKYLKGEHDAIYHYIGDRMITETPIIVDEEGNISFGRTRKIT